MNCFYSTALDGVVQGVSSALALFLIGYGYTFTKDYLTRRCLRKTLSHINAGRSYHGFEITINNGSDFDIVVKDVTLFDNSNTGVRLLFAYQQLDITVSEKRFKDERTVLLHSAELPDSSSPEWQLASIPLCARSSGVWIGPAVLFEQYREFSPVRCQFAVQYLNLLGKPRIIVVDVRSPNNIDIAEAFKKYKEEKTAGTLGKSLVQIPPKFVIVTTKKSFNQKAPI